MELRNQLGLLFTISGYSLYVFWYFFDYHWIYYWLHPSSQCNLCIYNSSIFFTLVFLFIPSFGLFLLFGSIEPYRQKRKMAFLFAWIEILIGLMLLVISYFQMQSLIEIFPEVESSILFYITGIKAVTFMGPSIFIFIIWPTKNNPWFDRRRYSTRMPP